VPKQMNKLIKPAMLTAIATLLVGVNFEAQAQQRERGERGQQQRERGEFNPEQFRERMNERLREQLGVKDEEEWKVIQPRIQRLTEARLRTATTGMGGMGAMLGRQGGPGGGGPGARGGAAAAGSQAAQELQQALDSNASAEQLKTRLANLRAERQKREAELKKAEDELKEVLTLRQEAQLVGMGLLR
jgi:hypothetical protein